MRLSGTLLTNDAPASVLVEDDRIIAVEPFAATSADDARRIIAPGFIDAHLHLPQFDAIGAPADDLLSWLDAVVFPHEARWSDPDYAHAMTQRVAQHLLSRGTTGVCAYATVHHQAAASAMHVLDAAGIRGHVGQVLMDRESPADLIRPAAQLLEEASQLDTVGRISPIVTPRFAISCSPELLAGAAKLARERAWPIQTHLAETQAECARVAQLFGVDRYLDAYDRAGITNAVFAHAVWLDDADRHALAAAGAVVAHCPTANDFLASGAMNLQSTQRAGVPVALGSDIAGGPDISMPRVARAMIDTARRLGAPPPPARDAWRMITQGNADALGWTDAGRIEPGAAADLVVIEPDVDWRSAPDPYGFLLYAWDDRWITRTIARGRVVYQRSS